MMPFAQNSDEIIKEFNSNKNDGLYDKQIANLSEKFGKNELQHKKKKSIIIKFLEQFKDTMIIILLIAAIISFATAIKNNDPSEFFEPILILAIVIANAILGIVQEGKAEKALDALSEMSSPHARVIRNGCEKIIDAKELLPGDIIVVEAGDFVPADARLIESSSLKVEESALTGESEPREKNATEVLKENCVLADRINMIYSGCSVVYGHATAIVTSIGMNTEMGKIAGLLSNETETQTPLQRKLSGLGKILGILAVAICFVIFFIGIMRGIPLSQMFMTSVSLAVSAIPEGLPAIVTIVLAIGVQRMAKQNAIIRKLPAVETLGSASVICSDKTGTLTQNKMTAVKAYNFVNNKMESICKKSSDSTKNLLTLGTLCCDGSIVLDDNNVKHIGDPTETAIVYASHVCGIEKNNLSSKYPRICDLPFDSDRKLMSVLCKTPDKNIIITKGAFDVLAKKCIDPDLKKAFNATETMSKEALRVLAIAYKEVESDKTEIRVYDESDLHLIGLIGIIDPARPEVKDAINVCINAGIRPVMITGDHILTACAIAKELGIMKPGDKAINGTELSKMSDSELSKAVSDISVYARVSPEDKIRIVKAWQNNNQTVAMTGDGVNDAPALKAADIGCAMGITGTDVAKGAADIVLTDDNFSTIVHAVREGRGIYNNIKRTIMFLLGTNIGEVFSVFFAMLIWSQSPLLSMHLLWINLVTDGLPAIALGREKVSDDVMLQAPTRKDNNIFTPQFGLRVLFQGMFFAIITLLSFWYGLASGNIEKARTIAFLVLSTSQVVHSFNMRSDKSLFKTGFFSNHYLNKANMLSFIMIVFVATIPGIRTLFALQLLSAIEYALIILICLSPIVVIEAFKTYKFTFEKK